jgi:ligand-binding sensor domain-containing protein
VHCVLADKGKVWVGTTKGLAVLEGKTFTVIGPGQGLSHSVVTALAVDPATGDLWAGTLRGLNRISAGKVETFTQTSSGLPNNVIYSVAVGKDAVWVATAAGVGRRDARTGSWSLFDATNTLMHEPWTYAVTLSPEKVYVGVWAGGIVEQDLVRGTWKEYRDPDGEMELDLAPDDGPISDITSWVTWEDGILWQASYTGVARYDGTRWKSYLEKKSPLVSNFVNFIAAKGRVAWICTDRGLTVTDGTSWATYKGAEGGGGTLEITRPGAPPERRRTATAMSNDFVLGASITENEVWLATSHGLTRGILAGRSDQATAARKTDTQGASR